MTAQIAACPQAWHAGLHAGLLRECRHDAGHRGWHQNADGTLQWGGKLTAAERSLAEAMRSADEQAQPQSGDRP